VFPVAALLLSLLISACATEKKQVAPDAWMLDKPSVLQSVEELKSGQKALSGKLTLLNQQLADQRTLNQQQMAANAARKEEIVQLKQQIRRLQIATSRLKKSRNISKQKMDRKIEKIAQAIKPVEQVDNSQDKEEEKDRYTAAYLALKSGRYEEAVGKFREFLKTYPNGQYSDQAYYWLAESYLAQNNTVRAIGNLEWLISHYPESTKHAAAMLELSQAYRGQERFEEAQSMLRRLIDMHADSPVAEQARKRLAASVNDTTRH
ncbi:MAG: tol-pal system protein YbgF, partial [Mariprofundaceae bacterium]|nr:tol-pal system protein YbgF [Mariprofundaceae bacterium]